MNTSTSYISREGINTYMRVKMVKAWCEGLHILCSVPYSEVIFVSPQSVCVLRHCDLHL